MKQELNIFATYQDYIEEMTRRKLKELKENEL